MDEANGGAAAASPAASTAARSANVTTRRPRPISFERTRRALSLPSRRRRRPRGRRSARPRHRRSSCKSNLVSPLAAARSASQLVTVVAANAVIDHRHDAALAALRRLLAAKPPGPWAVYLGFAGVSEHHREGDGTTPAGAFAIGPVIYGVSPNPGVHFAYHQLVCGDWWDEDPGSPAYNTFQHVPCGTAPPFRGSSEPLWRSPGAYAHLAFLEYNADPAVPGLGSAIFIHADLGHPTNGCISLPPSELVSLLDWLRPAAHPAGRGRHPRRGPQLLGRFCKHARRWLTLIRLPRSARRSACISTTAPVPSPTSHERSPTPAGTSARSTWCASSREARCATSRSTPRAPTTSTRSSPRCARSAGVEVEHVSDRTFLLHLGGKIEMVPKAPLKTRDDLSMAYTPGVARVCTAIAEDPSKVWNLTIKQNTVAVVSDGTAVLGLGDIGPEAAMPVMEGKAVLFKEFGGVDAWPICLATTDPDEIVAAVAAIAPGFGGINLEDISAPRCFEIESSPEGTARHPRLPRRPARNGDRRHRRVPECAQARREERRRRARRPDRRRRRRGRDHRHAARARRLATIIGCDRQGAIHVGRDGLGPWKTMYAERTNPERLRRDCRRGTRRRRCLPRALRARAPSRARESPRWPKGQSSSRWRTRRPR